jgi:hypothetical protein
MRVIPAEHEPLREALLKRAGDSYILEEALRFFRREHGRSYEPSVEQVVEVIDRLRSEDAKQQVAYRR